MHPHEGKLSYVKDRASKTYTDNLKFSFLKPYVESTIFRLDSFT